jgi:ABC-type polysaccharide/polyol phosphate transport system ATPase subunit
LIGTENVIEVRDVSKSYRVAAPGRRSRRSRLLHPVDLARNRRLQVLDGISFDVKAGEMFALLGRNGCGKSTLLRMIASIYSPDRGAIRARGRIAPLIELGVGFDPELTALQNIVLNGVMLGMAPGEVSKRSDAILEFAELEDFANVPLKNFSSGMQLRLAFAVVVQTEPDILLVDEIYAVGDAGFQLKCTEALLQLKAAGKTVVLVSHDMEMVLRLCDRAMLVERGGIDMEGNPADVVRRYFELTLEHRPHEVNDFLIESLAGIAPDYRARIDGLAISGPEGPDATFPPGTPIEIEASIDVERPIRAPGLRLEIRTEHGARVFSPSDPDETAEVAELGPCERVRAHLTVENRLSPGRYRLNCVVLHSDGDGIVAASPTESLAFEVTGAAHPGTGLVSLDHSVRFEPEREFSPK